MVFSARSAVRLLFGALAFVALACGSAPKGEGGGGAGNAGGTGGAPGEGGAGGAPPQPKPLCEGTTALVQPWNDAATGMFRGDVAADFTVPLVGRAPWRLKSQWNGCESFVFVPDSLAVSNLSPASVWEKDIDGLIAASPRNVHYFFVSRASTQEAAAKSTLRMRQRIDGVLATLSPEDQAHWDAHLHVVGVRHADLGNWVGDAMKGHGRAGLAIDRFQRVRGMGYLADVTRYKEALNAAGYWPWESNLAYAAHEPRLFNFEATREARLEGEHATVVPFWNGEVLEQFAELDVDLPSAEAMATFDTLEVDITSACPNKEAIEFNNCGAWDYIAALYVQENDGTFSEIARFITSYHRETRWVVDITPMLVKLKEGGKRHFKWEFAPEWNKQPTATKLSLRFSNQGKPYKPAEVTPLFAGGGFTTTYNDAYAPKDIPIPADAKRVDVWAIITGHGADTSQCSEFCNHQHDFTVNGVTFRKEHKVAGTNKGCIDEVDRGMVPNQAGTWWFGRGGWCPGQLVEPFIADATPNVVPGQTANVSYKGLFKNKTPPNNAGNIVMTSYLVVYK